MGRRRSCVSDEVDSLLIRQIETVHTTDWSAFDDWTSPASVQVVPHSWSGLDAWLQPAREAAQVVEADWVRLRRLWDLRLEPLGGDPSRVDWEKFRPLRLSREEDWSDWLAFLLETSTEGAISKRLFAKEPDAPKSHFARPRTFRETPTADASRRGDIVIQWASGAWSHIEVKVGDQNFDKTFETALALRAKHAGSQSWNDFILIPEESVLDWEESQERMKFVGITVNPLIWNDVALALRCGLWEERESLLWRAWAMSFCGAIEEKLLGLGSDESNPRDRASTLLSRAHQLSMRTDLMQRGSVNEENT